MEPQGDIALIGLAVMGRNLILNMNDHGYTVVAHNRTVARVDEFINGEAAGTKVIGARSISEMVAQLKRPRRVILRDRPLPRTATGKLRRPALAEWANAEARS